MKKPKPRKWKRIELSEEAIRYWNGNKFKPYVEHLLEKKAITI